MWRAISMAKPGGRQQRAGAKIAEKVLILRAWRHLKRANQGRIDCLPDAFGAGGNP